MNYFKKNGVVFEDRGPPTLLKGTLIEEIIHNSEFFEQKPNNIQKTSVSFYSQYKRLLALDSICAKNITNLV